MLRHYGTDEYLIFKFLYKKRKCDVNDEKSVELKDKLVSSILICALLLDHEVRNSRVVRSEFSANFRVVRHRITRKYKGDRVVR